MSVPPNPRQYPVPCPQCDEPKGFPFEVRTIADHSGSIEVKLRCRDCHHEWVELVTTAD
jgi:hypothetical protein